MTRAPDPAAAATPTAERASSSCHACSPDPCVRAEPGKGQRVTVLPSWRSVALAVRMPAVLPDGGETGDGEIGSLPEGGARPIQRHRQAPTHHTTCDREKTPTRRPVERGRCTETTAQNTYPTCGVLCVAYALVHRVAPQELTVCISKFRSLIFSAEHVSCNKLHCSG